MKKCAFITGVNGQDGAYLADFLLKKKYQVSGLAEKASSMYNIEYFGIQEKLDLREGDIRNSKLLYSIVKDIRPTEIYNLAAHTTVADSWEKIKIVNEVNYLALISLLQIIKSLDPKIRFYQAASSEMFGNKNTEGAKTEETALDPQNPYATSKSASYFLVKNYRAKYNLFLCNGISFNHESPLRPPHFVTRKITQGVAKIKSGLQDHIELGNLEAKRDWGFAGDYVEAMWLMLQQKKPDDYILATGKTHTVKQIADIAFRYVGIKNWKHYIQIKEEFKRPFDSHTPAASNERAKRVLHWKPKTTFSELIEMMVAADMKRVKQL